MFLKSMIICLFVLSIALTFEFVFIFKIEEEFNFLVIIKKFLFLYFSPLFSYFFYLLYINSKDEVLKKYLFCLCTFFIVISYVYSFLIHLFFVSMSQIFTE